MARIISGQRIARSYVTPNGANVVSREIDFQLGAAQGIEIDSVLGFGSFADLSPAVSDTVPVSARATQTLHLETGTLEDVPTTAGEDEDDIDTEMFYLQMWGLMFQVPATSGGGGGALTVTPSGLVTFREPIRTARNITHRGETLATDNDLNAGVFIYYHYILFTDAELGFLLARRQ